MKTEDRRAYPFLEELMSSMEEVRDAWSLLEVIGLAPDTPSGPLGSPGRAGPPPRACCVLRDLGRLAKRPSAIILNSADRQSNGYETHWDCCVNCSHSMFVGP